MKHLRKVFVGELASRYCARNIERLLPPLFEPELDFSPSAPAASPIASASSTTKSAGTNQKEQHLRSSSASLLFFTAGSPHHCSIFLTLMEEVILMQVSSQLRFCQRALRHP